MIEKLVLRRSSLLALVVATASAGCAVSLGNGQITVTKPFSAKMTVKTPAELHVDVPIGTITIKPGPADSTEVKVTGTLGAADQATLNNVGVTVSQDDDGTTNIKASGPQGKSWKADLTITTPAKTNLRAEAGVGNATVTGLEGRIKAQAGVGDVRIESLTATGDSTFESGTGSVELEVAAWPKDTSVTASSGTGHVSVRLPANQGLKTPGRFHGVVGNLSTSGLKLPSGARSKTVVGGAIKGRTEADPEGRTLKATSGTGDVKIEAQ